MWNSDFKTNSEQANSELQLFALGVSSAYQGEHELVASSWTYTKVKELLFFLLANHAATKEQIGLALWPNASTRQLRNNLHEALYYLRRTLGRSEWIIYEQRRYAFNRGLPYWYDVESFTQLISHARHLQTDAPIQASIELEKAILLYRGDFLEDLIAGNWSLERRDEIRRMYQDTLLLLGRLYVVQRRYTQAAETYRKLIAHDYYLEVAHRELMRCYAYLGERGQALRHYQDLAKWMHETLGTHPATKTKTLFERLHSGVDSE